MCGCVCVWGGGVCVCFVLFLFKLSLISLYMPRTFLTNLEVGRKSLIDTFGIFHGNSCFLSTEWAILLRIYTHALNPRPFLGLVRWSFL